MKGYTKRSLSIVLAAIVLVSMILFTSCGDKKEEDKTNKTNNTNITYVNFTIKPANDYDATGEQLDSTKVIIETRLESIGVTDYDVSVDIDNELIIVKYPLSENKKEDKVINEIEQLSEPAKLTFRPGCEYEETITDKDGNPVYKTPKGETTEILLDGSYVKSAEACADSNTGDAEKYYVVNIEFNKEGAEKFKEITEKYTGQVISVWMDDIMISAPMVQAVISDGKAQINGDFTADEAKALASKINSGAIPFDTEIADYSIK